MISANDDWGRDFSELLSHIDLLAEALRQTADLVQDRDRSDCLRYDPPPPQLPSVARSFDELETIRSLASGLTDRLTERPVFLYVRGHLISREQYYLLLARDLLTLRVDGTDPYDRFRMFHYEDDTRRCYINPDVKPLPGNRIAVRFGVPPEEVAWNQLRPEQQEYFSRNDPEVAGRFMREA